MKSILCVVILIGVSGIMSGCERQERPRPSSSETGDKKREPVTKTQEEQWKFWLSLEDLLGRKVLDIEESRLWIEEHRDEVSIPAELDFLKTHVVAELPYLLQDVRITGDLQGNRRVSMKKHQPPVWPPAGFMNEADSLAWFEGKGYDVTKDDDGYTLTKTSYGGDVHRSEQTKIGWGSTIIRADAAIITGWNGGIAVKPR